jgi:hypothetical protein
MNAVMVSRLFEVLLPNADPLEASRINIIRICRIYQAILVRFTVVRILGAIEAIS